jgi:hypothetical protein
MVLELLLELNNVFQHQLLFRGVLSIGLAVLRLRSDLKFPAAFELLVDDRFAVLQNLQ